MEESIATVNKLMVEVFDDILMIEQSALRSGRFYDVSVTESHTIEAIGMYVKQTTSQVAKELKVTVGTLTVAVNNLVKKGYVQRIRSEDDRRVVKLGLTNKGRLLYRVHKKFHADMIKETMVGLSVEEEKVLVSALANLHNYFVKSLSKFELNLDNNIEKTNK